MKSHEENTWQVARTWQSARAGNAAELRAALRCELIRWGSDFLWGLDHGYCTKEHILYCIYIYTYIYTMIWYDMTCHDMILWYIHIIQICLFENALYIIYICKSWANRLQVDTLRGKSNEAFLPNSDNPQLILTEIVWRSICYMLLLYLMHILQLTNI